MRGTWVVLAALAGCGDNLAATGAFEVVAHADLGARGMNSALAVAGDTIYVGSRIDQKPILILDTATLAVVGEIPGVVGMSSRELRAVDNTLIVLNLVCSPELHGCARGATMPEHLALYDISNRRAPALLATYPITGGGFLGRGPHEMYIRRDADRVFVFVAAPGGSPQLEVVDITNPATPARFAAWDPRMDGLKPSGADDILHSVSLSADGKQAYLSHQLSGLYVADVTGLPAVHLITPVGSGLDWAPPGAMGPHSAVEIPGRKALVVSEEVYPPPFGAGCPWGHVRTVDVSNPAAPALLAEVKLPENDLALCGAPVDRVAFTAHNATVTSELAIITWYAGGLVAIWVADPAQPRIIAQLRPDPLPSVAVEDPGLGGNPVEMWSYPVIQNGLIYVIDVRNGLYVIRYTGTGEETIAKEAFLEGNSNL